MYTIPIRTADGWFAAGFSDRGLATLEFPKATAGRTRTGPRARLPQPVRAWLAVTERSLQDVLAGRTPRQWPPLDVAAGTTFQQQVWTALRQIPSGETRTYTEVAAQIGRPKAVRAVGQACGANPIPVLIPCHRVRAAGGGLGGFSGGLEWKQLLLRREGALPATA